MNINMEKLIVLILGLVEIIAGFSLYEKSQLGGITFIGLGLAFFSIMFVMDLKYKQSKHYKGK